MSDVNTPTYTKKDFESDQAVRWCPGCGDYGILAQTQKTMPTFGRKKEDFVFVSGIGCSSRFPYYMNAYGFHTIHGRAPAVASGVKIANPDLSVWVITGDGDGLSIGGNHFMHALRRNMDLNILLFNNRIYGLTKGQYSPTSKVGHVTKASPFGSLDIPLNPPSLALGAQATFVARTIDRWQAHLAQMLERSYHHDGGSLIEIYQNCNIFNDGAFGTYTDKEIKKENSIYLEHGKPLIYGAKDDKGIVLDGFQPRIVDLTSDTDSSENLWIHDVNDRNKANILTRFFDDPSNEGALPRPFGIFYQEKRFCYEDALVEQLEYVNDSNDLPDLDKLLSGLNTWEIK